MHAGDLDRQITLRSVSVSQNSFGEPEKLYSDFGVVWAKVVEQSGREIILSGVEHAQKRIVACVRYMLGITTDMKIVYNGDEYDIEVINEIGRREGLELVCKRLLG